MNRTATGWMFWIVFAAALPLSIACDRSATAPASRPAATGNAMRIVSLAPNITEICCALGLREQLVGRSKFCDYPPGILDVPALGGLLDPNVEGLLRAAPDLILVAGRSASLSEQLKRLKLRFESLPDSSLGDIFTAARKIGVLTSRTAAAEAFCEDLQAELDAVAVKFADVPSARVLFLVRALADPPEPPFVAGPTSFYDELLILGGHTNAAADLGKAYAPLSLETILVINPDVIVEIDPEGTARPNGDADALRVWSKVGSLAAVTSKRVHVLSGRQYSIAGPRVVETFRDLCAAIARGKHD